MTLTLGEPAPEFELPDTDGTRWSAGDGGAAAATVVVFTCNHCPYALAWHDRIAEAARDYADRGVRFLAINSNDAERYPRDSYEAMRRRVAAEDWPMPYLHDATQEVARAYGAKTTPDVFVLDSERPAALPRRAGLRLRRSRAERRVAARRARRGAGRTRSPCPAGDAARRLLDQVEGELSLSGRDVAVAGSSGSPAACHSSSPPAMLWAS